MSNPSTRYAVPVTPPSDAEKDLKAVEHLKKIRRKRTDLTKARIRSSMLAYWARARAIESASEASADQ
jgi:hypothetical protein